MREREAFEAPGEALARTRRQTERGRSGRDHVDGDLPPFQSVPFTLETSGPVVKQVRPRRATRPHGRVARRPLGSHPQALPEARKRQPPARLPPRRWRSRRGPWRARAGAWSCRPAAAPRGAESGPERARRVGCGGVPGTRGSSDGKLRSYSNNYSAMLEPARPSVRSGFRRDPPRRRDGTPPSGAPPMSCAGCGFENPAEVRFCGNCARPLGRRCHACGFENPPAFRFCGGCAAPLAADDGPRLMARPDPRSYTPRHLAEKILTSRSALEGERLAEQTGDPLDQAVIAADAHSFCWTGRLRETVRLAEGHRTWAGGPEPRSGAVRNQRLPLGLEVSGSGPARDGSSRRGRIRSRPSQSVPGRTTLTLYLVAGVPRGARVPRWGRNGSSDARTPRHRASRRSSSPFSGPCASGPRDRSPGQPGVERGRGSRAARAGACSRARRRLRNCRVGALLPGERRSSVRAILAPHWS